MPLTFKLIHHHHHLSNTLPSSSHPLHTTQYYLSPIYYPQNTAHKYIYSLNILSTTHKFISTPHQALLLSYSIISSIPKFHKRISPYTLSTPNYTVLTYTSPIVRCTYIFKILRNNPFHKEITTIFCFNRYHFDNYQFRSKLV